MPLPEKKASTPFKTMDIKSALLASGNRKRKASSPQKPKIDPKSVKLSVESSEGENDLKISDEACGITITIDKNELESNHVECKENKDINTAKVETLSPNCSDNKLLNSVKDDLPSHKNAIPCNGKLHSKSSEHISDMDLDQLSEKSKHSDNSSCDELNAVNVSMNTSGLSVTGDDDEKVNNSPVSDAKNVSNNSVVKVTKDESKRAKKQKMTPAEAKKKTEERGQKDKERMLKKQEIENKKIERKLEKEQKLREKQFRKEREEMERKERERLKQEKKEQEEKERLQKQKEKEEERLQKLKEKEEKQKIKQMMLEHKMEEKKKKEEMRLKREEEMKKAEEEKLKAKLEKEQKEREKKERAKAAFAKYFLKGETNSTTAAPQVPEKEGAFLPFQVSDDMILAPVIPAAAQERFNKEHLDYCLKLQDSKELYLDILRSGSYIDARLRKKNNKLAPSDADIIVIDKNAELGLRPKLLQFCENVRPPYWGTWRRKSKSIHPRNPFGQDEIFDYDVDSDDEWDEGGPGESLSGTENEDESEDDYEVDNEFFVPHGYLSDEEEKKEDDDEEVNDPEKQKALLKLKLQEFEKERKKKTTELKPIILGCYFMNDPAFQDSGLHGFLEVYSAVFLTDTTIPTSFNKSQLSDSTVNTSESPNSSSGKKKKILFVPEEAFPDLIRLIHGNTKNRKVLAEIFQKFWLEQFGETQETKTEADKIISNTVQDASQETVNDLPLDSAQISLRQLNHTIREIASYGKPPNASFNKCCWWVNDEVRKKYGLMDAPIPNQWNYASQKDSEHSAKANCPTIKEFLSNNVEK